MTDHSKPVHFLLVEDDEDHADLVARAMREHRVGNTMSRVADGEAALDYLYQRGGHAKASRPDVVLLDLNLPKLGGQEVLSTLKSDPELSAIPVVVLTTSEADADRVKAYASRANSYVVKPLDFQQFHDMVRQLGMYWSIWNRPPA
ncbi:MAG: response regulator [Tepidisphaera sp.]|nr:response regulator [Tepidisphaera sp.]